MQVNPVEVWDLLKLLGLEGRWGASEEHFLRFFEEIRNPFGQRDWPFLLGMARDHLETGGHIDPAFAEAARRKLGPVTWNAVRRLPTTIKARGAIPALEPAARSVLGDMIRHHTPIRTFVWRNGRDLLHRYRERGILTERVPKRHPRNEWIAFTPDEQDLYDRIEEYISHFYRKYEEQRRGLGFVMTVYRRRLTSSFHAARESLERRRAVLLSDDGEEVAEAFTDEDIEQDDLAMDAAEGVADLASDARDQELAYLDDFIAELNALSVDSKLEFLKDQLATILRTHDSAILFTQYTDTMDYLRDSLLPVYGTGIACYSGRGGESWNGARWIVRNKEDIKEEFRAGDTIRLLLCTESASEGLNLQTCGVLINYDMPWNPMRVEQRIGRIDRIGQRHRVVHIHNYFFRDTVEALVYDRLSDRIDWFEHVVGALQPILHNVDRAIRKLAMMGRRDREAAFDDALAKIESQADSRDRAGIDLDALVDDTIPTAPESTSPVTLEDIEGLFLTSELTRHRFLPHTALPDVYWLRSAEPPRAVTFRPEIFDRHPSSVELLTYGNPTFDALLDEVAGPPSDEADPPGQPAGATMLLRDHGDPPVAVCVVKDRDGMTAVRGVSEYQRAAMEHEAEWSGDDREHARRLLGAARAALEQQAVAARDETRSAKRRGLREEARQILLQSAHILAAQEGFFASGEHDVIERLCRRGVPYPGLRKILQDDLPEVAPTDPIRAEVEGKTPVALTQLFSRLREQGMEVLRRYREYGRL